MVETRSKSQPPAQRELPAPKRRASSATRSRHAKRLQEILQRRLENERIIARRAKLVADRAIRARNRALRQQAATTAQLAAVKAEPEKQLTMTVSFYLPMRHADGSHATELVARRRGVGERKHHKATSGHYFHEVQTVHVAVPKSAWTGLEADTVYWHADAEREPSIPDDHPILAVPELAAHWAQLANVSNQQPGIRFSDVEELQGSGKAHNSLVVANLDTRQRYMYSKYTTISSAFFDDSIADQTAPPAAKRAKLAAAAETDPAVMKAPMGRACGPDIVLSLYADAVTAYQKGAVPCDPQRRFVNSSGDPIVTMTREGLWRFWYPHVPYPGDASDFPVSLLQFRELFRALKIKLTVLDGQGRLIQAACYTPTVMRVKGCYVIQSHSHLYALNHRIAELAQRSAQHMKLDEEVPAPTAPQMEALADQVGAALLQELPQGMSAPHREPRIIEVSSHSFVPTTKQLDTVWVESLSELSQLSWSEYKRKVRIVCDLDLSIVAGEFLRLGVVPGFKRKHSHLTALRLLVQPVWEDRCKPKPDPLDVVLTVPDTPDFDGRPLIPSKGEYELYQRHTARLMSVLLSHATKSNYSTSVQTALHELMPSPLYFSLGSHAYETSTIDHDGCRFYTHLLANMQHAPVYNVFDQFLPYDQAQGLDLPAMYIVRKKDPRPLLQSDRLFILLDRDVNLVQGHDLKLLLPLVQFHAQFTIESVCRPSQLARVRGDVQACLKGLYESGVSNELVKFAVNRVVGLLGRKRNERSQTAAFLDINEALAYAAEVGASPSKAVCGHSPVFFVTKSQEALLCDGWRPLYHHVLRASRRALYQRVVEQDRPYVAIKTDCIHFVAEQDVAVPKATDWASVLKGSWSVGQGNVCPLKRNQMHYGEITDPAHVPVALALQQLPNYEVADEYSDEQVGEVIHGGGGLLLLAKYPGSGKSTAMLRYCLSHKLNSIAAVPYNALAQNILHEHEPAFTSAMLILDAVTAHHLLGVQLTDEGGQKGKAKLDLSAVQVVIVDEVFSWTIDLLARLYQRMQDPDCAHVAWYGCGDGKQLPAIQRTRFTAEDQLVAYYNQYVLPLLFPRGTLTLKVAKRAASPQSRALLELLYSQIWEQKLPLAQVWANFPSVAAVSELPTDTVAFSFHRATARAIGQALHGLKVAGRKDVIPIDTAGQTVHKGQQQRCLSYLKLKEGKLHPNMLVTVKAANVRLKEAVVETAAGVSFRLSFRQLAASFQNLCGQTVHSSQGTSAAGAVVIADTDSGFVSRRWAWTAITRARDLQRVYVFRPTEEGADALGLTEAAWLRFWAAKVPQYRSQDLAAGRDVSGGAFVTAASLHKMCLAADFRCTHCGETCDTLKSGDHQATADRVDNDVAHIQANVELSCLCCNRARK